MINNIEVINYLSKMSVIEMANLVKELEKKFDVNTDNIINNNVNNQINKSNNKISKEEKKEFNILLKEIGKNKISVIRIVRNILSLGLKEAKDLVESAPILLKEKINKMEAENIKSQLQEVGAIIEIN